MDASYRIHRRLLVEELEPRIAPVLYKTIPYTQTFNGWAGGNAGWTYYSTAGGYLSLEPPGSTNDEALRMQSKSPSSTYDLNEAILHLNLNGKSDVWLEFEHRDCYDEPNAMPTAAGWTGHKNGDGVAISNDDGATWYTILNLGRSLNWQTISIDMDQAVAAAGISYSSTFLVKFQQYDNQAWLGTSGDGREFDTVKLFTVVPGPVNYKQDFSSGKPTQGWAYYSDNVGRTQVVGGALRMDTSSNGYSLNEAILTLNLTGQSDVKLQFDHRDSYDEFTAMPTGTWAGHQNGDGVAISADAGATWYSLTSLGRELSWTTHTIDLDAVMGGLGWTYSADFRIKLQQYDNTPWSADGREFDNIWVIAAGAPTNFILNADADGEAYYYYYGGSIASIIATDADANAVVAGTWNAGSGTYNIGVTNRLDSFQSTKANFTDFNVDDSIGNTGIASNVSGTFTVVSFGSSDVLNINGTLNSFTTTGAGGLAGDIAANQITGTITTGVGGVTGTGSVVTTNDFNSMVVGGNMAGALNVGRDLLGGVDVTGDISGTMSIARHITGASAFIRTTGAGTDLTGTITVGQNIQNSGYIQIADSITGTGSINVTGNISTAGYVQTGGDIAGTGSINVTGSVTSTRGDGAIDINGAITSSGAHSIRIGGSLDSGASVQIYGSADSGAPIELLGAFNGMVRVGLDGAGLFGDVTVATNIGVSYGMLRAYNDNDSATLTTDDTTAAQLTYHRDFGNYEDNDPNTLFGGGISKVLTGSGTYDYTDSDGDTVRITYTLGAATVTVTFTAVSSPRDIDTIAYVGATDACDLDISVITVVGNGATTAGEVSAAGQVFGTFTVDGWIESWTGGELASGEEISTNPGGALGDVGAISLENDIAGTIRVGNNVTGLISTLSSITGSIIVGNNLAAGVSAGVDIDGTITVSGSTTIGGSITAGTNIDGAINVTGSIGGAITATAGNLTGAIDAGADIDAGITVGGSTTAGGTITAGVNIDGAINVTGSIGGAITATAGNVTAAIGAGADIDAGITVGGSTTAGGTITAGVNIDGAINVTGSIGGAIMATAGNLTAAIGAGADIDGNITVGGSTTAGGTITAAVNIDGAINVTGSIGGTITATAGNLTAAIGAGADIDAGITVGGATTVGGTITAGVNIDGAVNVTGNIGGAITATTGNIMNTIHTSAHLRALISAPGGLINTGIIDIDGIIDASNGGAVLLNVPAGSGTWTYYEGADTKTATMVGLGGTGIQGAMLVGGAAGQEGGVVTNQARANLTLLQNATSLTTTGINFNNMNVQTIGTISIGSAIEGTLTMVSFGSTATLTITGGSLNNMTITGTGGLAGDISVGSVTGLITTGSGGVTSTGSVITTGNFGALNSAGDMAGLLQVGGNMTGGSVISSVSGAILVGGNVAGGASVAIGAGSFRGGYMLIGGSNLGTIAVNSVVQTYVDSWLHGGRNLSGTMEDPNPFDTISVLAADDLRLFWDGYTDVRYAVLHGSAGVSMIYASDDLNSIVAQNMNVDSIRVLGRVKGQATVIVGDGTINSTGIGVDIGGNLGFLRVERFDHPDYSVHAGGNLGSVVVENGILEGSITTTAGGNLTGSITTASGQVIRGNITIAGNITASGSIMPGGDSTPASGENITGTISVGGFMAGKIYAYRLGNTITNENSDSFAMKGNITVGGNITGAIDIVDTIANYSYISATGAIASVTFDGSAVATGIRVQGLGGTAALRGAIITKIALNDAVSWSFGDDTGTGTRTFELTDQNLWQDYWLALDGRNLASVGWTFESPTISCTTTQTLATWNTILSGITYDGTANSVTTLASLSDVIFTDFTTGAAGTVTLLNAGNLTMIAANAALGTGDVLKVKNVVWGKIDLGANAMAGFIDIDGNLVWDADNRSDGYIVSTGQISSYDGVTTGIRISGLGAATRMGGRIRTAYGDLNAARNWSIGDGLAAGAGLRTFSTANLGLTQVFDLMLDGRTVNAGVWTMESPTLMRTAASSALTIANWETIRTNVGTTYTWNGGGGGGAAANGLSLSAGTGSDFSAWAGFTTYNLHDITLTDTAIITNATTLTINNDLWGTLTAGSTQSATYVVAGTIDIKGDLRGEIKFNGGFEDTGLIKTGRDFAQGGKITYAPLAGSNFRGDMMIAGNWLGVLDIQGAATGIYRNVTTNGSLITINGNFGAPNVTGGLITIADGRLDEYQVTAANAGIRIGYDGGGIMYGDILVLSQSDTTATNGYVRDARLDIGLSGYAGAQQAYMDHSAAIIAGRYLSSPINIYNQNREKGLEGQILVGTRQTVTGTTYIGIATYVVGGQPIIVNGGMGEQGEIRSLSALGRAAASDGVYINTGGFNAPLTFTNDIKGVIAVGDGYVNPLGSDESFATFGKGFAVIATTAGTDFSGVIRSTSKGYYEGGVFQGVANYGEIDIVGDMTGKIVGYFLPDIELTGASATFSGSIEVFDNFRGGGLRIAGTNSGTIRARGVAQTYYSGTKGVGETVPITTPNGNTLVWTCNTAATTYSYLWSGSDDYIPMFRVEGSNNTQSLVGNGVKLGSFYSEGTLAGGTLAIDMNDRVVGPNQYDSALYSVRLNTFPASAKIEVEGQLGQVTINSGDLNATSSITTTQGAVSSTAGLSGIIYGLTQILGTYSFAGDVGAAAGFYATTNIGGSAAGKADIDVAGDMKGYIYAITMIRNGTGGTDYTTIDITGNVPDNAWIIGRGSAAMSGTINIGGDLAGRVWVGDATADSLADISGTIGVAGQLNSTGQIFAYGATGITSVGRVSIGTGIESGGSITMWEQGGVAGVINIGGDVYGANAIRLGNATADTASNLSGTINLASGSSNPSLYGGIKVYGTTGITGAINIEGEIGANGLIYLYGTGADLSGSIAVDGGMSGTGYIRIEDSITGTGKITVTGAMADTSYILLNTGGITTAAAYSISVGGMSSGAAITVAGDASTGAEMRILGEFDGTVRVGSGGAGTFGNVTVSSNAGSTGTFRAFNRNAAATLSDGDSGATSGQLTYIRDTDVVTSSVRSTLFKKDNTVVLLAPADGANTYGFTDFDGDTVLVTYTGPSGSTVTLDLVNAGVGRESIGYITYGGTVDDTSDLLVDVTGGTGAGATSGGIVTATGFTFGTFTIDGWVDRWNGGTLATGETITISGSLSSGSFAGDMDGDLSVGTNVIGPLSIAGSVNGDLDIGGSLNGALSIGANLTGTSLSVGGDVNAAVSITGDLSGALTVTGALASTITIAGANGVTGTGVITVGSMPTNVGRIITSVGPMAGTIDVTGTGNMGGYIYVGDDDTDTGADLSGLIHIGGDMTSSGRVLIRGAGGITGTGLIDVDGTMVGTTTQIYVYNGPVANGGTIDINSSSNMSGYIYIGDVNGDTGADLAGLIHIGGDMTSSGRILVRGLGGITSTGVVDVDGSMVGAAALVYTYTGPIAGTVNVDGDLSGYIYAGTATTDPASVVISGNVTVGSMSGAARIRSFGTNAMTGAITVNGNFTGTGYIYTGGDVTTNAITVNGNLGAAAGSDTCYIRTVSVSGTGSIAVTGAIQSSSYISITGSLTGSGAVSVGGIANSGYIAVTSNVDGSSTITVNGNITSSRAAGAIDIGGNFESTILVNGDMNGVIDSDGTVGANAKIDITGTMSSTAAAIDLAGAMPSATFTGSNLDKGLRVQGLDGGGVNDVLKGYIRTAVDMDNNINWSFGDDTDSHVRTFVLNDQNIVGTAWLMLDGRDLAESGYQRESPTLEITTAITLAQLNAAIGAITYTGGAGTFVSVGNVTLSDFGIGTTGTLTVLNCGALTITEAAGMDNADTITVANDVWGQIYINNGAIANPAMSGTSAIVVNDDVLSTGTIKLQGLLNSLNTTGAIHVVGDVLGTIQITGSDGTYYSADESRIYVDGALKGSGQIYFSATGTVYCRTDIEVDGGVLENSRIYIAGRARNAYITTGPVTSTRSGGAIYAGYLYEKLTVNGNLGAGATISAATAMATSTTDGQIVINGNVEAGALITTGYISTTGAGDEIYVAGDMAGEIRISATSADTSASPYSLASGASINILGNLTGMINFNRTTTNSGIVRGNITVGGNISGTGGIYVANADVASTSVITVGGNITSTRSDGAIDLNKDFLGTITANGGLASGSSIQIYGTAASSTKIAVTGEFDGLIEVGQGGAGSIVPGKFGNVTIGANAGSTGTLRAYADNNSATLTTGAITAGQLTYTRDQDSVSNNNPDTLFNWTGTVLNPGDSYGFTDQDGDTVTVTYAGGSTGQVGLVLTAAGLGYNLTSLEYIGASASSDLGVLVTVNVGDGMTGVGTVYAEAGDFGLFTLDGWITTWSGDLAGDLDILGDVNSTMTITGNLAGTSLTIGGSLTAALTVNGNLTGALTVTNALTNTITISGASGVTGTGVITVGDMTASASKIVTSQGPMAGTINVGGSNLGGSIFIGDATSDTAANISGTISVTGQLASTGKVYAYGTGGIASGGLVSIGTGIVSGGLIRTIEGGMAGRITVGGDVNGASAIYIGDATTDTGANLSGTIQLTGGSSLLGGIRVYGQGGVTSAGRIAIGGALGTGGSIRTYSDTGGVMAGTISIGTDISSAATDGIYIGDAVTDTAANLSGTITVGGQLAATARVYAYGAGGIMGTGRIDVGNGMATGSVIRATDGPIAGSINVTGNVDGAIWAGNATTDTTANLSGTISITGQLTSAGAIYAYGTGGITGTGRIDIGGGVASGLIRTTEGPMDGTINITGDAVGTNLVWVGNAVTDTIANLGGTINITGAGSDLLGQIRVYGSTGITGAINVAGEIGTGGLIYLYAVGLGADLSGSITVGGGMSGTGYIRIEDCITSTGSITVTGDIAGTSYIMLSATTGTIDAGGTLTVNGNITSTAAAAIDINGTGNLAGSIIVNGNVAGVMDLEGNVTGKIDVDGLITSAGFIDVAGTVANAVVDGGGVLTAGIRVQDLGVTTPLDGRIKANLGALDNKTYTFAVGTTNAAANMRTFAVGATALADTGSVVIDGRYRGTNTVWTMESPTLVLGTVGTAANLNILLNATSYTYNSVATNHSVTPLTSIDTLTLTGAIPAATTVRVFNMRNTTLSGVINATGVLTIQNVLYGTLTHTGVQVGRINVWGTDGVTTGGNITQSAVANDIGATAVIEVQALTGTGLITVQDDILAGGVVRVLGDISGTAGIRMTGVVDPVMAGSIVVNGNITSTRTGGAIYLTDITSGTVTVGGTMGGLISLVAAGTSTGSITATATGAIIINNNVTGAGEIRLAGSVSGTRAAGAIDVNGDLAGKIAVTGSVAAGATVDVSGSISGTCGITTNLAGLLKVGSNVSGAVNIGGAYTGTLTIGSALSGTVDITGNANAGTEIQIGSMSGTGVLLAALFGDVEVYGNFQGQIGDGGTADGAGTLQIHSSGNTINGWVTKAGVLQAVTGEILGFNGAFVNIDDLDV